MSSSDAPIPIDWFVSEEWNEANRGCCTEAESSVVPCPPPPPPSSHPQLKLQFMSFLAAGQHTNSCFFGLDVSCESYHTRKCHPFISECHHGHILTVATQGW
ncbi:unnamed protein product [Musa acuminata subsp. burmannicoides]